MFASVEPVVAICTPPLVIRWPGTHQGPQRPPDQTSPGPSNFRNGGQKIGADQAVDRRRRQLDQLRQSYSTMPRDLVSVERDEIDRQAGDRRGPRLANPAQQSNRPSCAEFSLHAALAIAAHAVPGLVSGLKAPQTNSASAAARSAVDGKPIARLRATGRNGGLVMRTTFARRARRAPGSPPRPAMASAHVRGSGPSRSRPGEGGARRRQADGAGGKRSR